MTLERRVLLGVELEDPDDLVPHRELAGRRAQPLEREAPEVGAPTSMVLIDYLHESWQHPEADVEKFADKVRAFVK